jgi:hypothetical protein
VINRRRNFTKRIVGKGKEQNIEIRRMTNFKKEENGERQGMVDHDIFFTGLGRGLSESESKRKNKK